MANRFNICMVDANQLASVVRNRIDNVLILDSRSFLEYNASHAINAINVGCAKLVKRRLQQNRLTIQDFLVHNCHWDVDTSIDIVVYDQNTQNVADLPPDSFMSVFLGKLLPVYKSVNFLKGGFLDFQASYPNLCEDEKAKFTPLTSVSQPCLPISNNGPTRILSFLYLGSQHDALNKEVLQSHNITYELNVSTNCPKPDFIQEARFMRIPVIDNYSDKLLPYFPRAFQFLDKVRESGGCVLVHCLAGISRSATVAIAYIMRHLKLSSDDAYRYVKAKRATISPNFNFLGQLLEYENQLQKEKILDPKSESETLMTSAVWNEKYENEMFHDSLVPNKKQIVPNGCESAPFNLTVLPEVPTISLEPYLMTPSKSTNERFSMSRQKVTCNDVFIKSEIHSPKIEAGGWSSKCIPVSSLKELNFTPCQAAVQTSLNNTKPRERYSPRQSNMWSVIDSFVKTNTELSEQVHVSSHEKFSHFDFASLDMSLNECRQEIPKSASCGAANVWSEKTLMSNLPHIQNAELYPKTCLRSNSTSTSGLGSESSDCFDSWSDFHHSGDREMDSLTSEEFGTVPMDDEEEYRRRKMSEIGDSYEETSLYSKFDDFNLLKNVNHPLSSLDDCFGDYSPTSDCQDFVPEKRLVNEEKYSEVFKCSLNSNCEKDGKKSEKPSCGLYRAQSCPGIFSSELVPCSSTCDHAYNYTSVHLRTTQATSAERACKLRNRYSCGSLDYVDDMVQSGLQKSCVDVPSFSSTGTPAVSTLSPSHQLFRHSMIQVS